MKCIFCKEKVNPTIPRLDGGGRLSCCKSCIEELQHKGLVGKANGKIELKKPLLEVLTS